MPHLRTSGTSRLTLLDYARAIASQRSMATTGEIISVVRLHADANCEKAEYAILIRSDLTGPGTWLRLMVLMICYARSEGLTHAFNPFNQSLKLRPILPAVGRLFFAPSGRRALSDHVHGQARIAPSRA